MDGARLGEVSLPRTDADTVLLSWTVHPIVDRPGKTALLAVLCIPFLGVLLRFFDPVYTVIAAGMLIMFLSGYFFPTSYHLTATGVTIRSRFYRGTKMWEEFDRWHAYPDAVFLLHPGSGVRNRLVRGSLLLLKNNRDEVLDVVRWHIGGSG